MDDKAKIWLSAPHMEGTEKKYVNEAFATNWIAPLGPNVDGFENDIVGFTHAGYAAALTSGTAAIHLALILLGVKPGDLVICQSFTFSASANPIRYMGAIPVFVDSEPTTWNICPKYMEETIQACISGELAKKYPGLGLSKRGQVPKAIIPVHLYGMPAQMDKIMEIARKYRIAVIEDAAEAMGSTYRGGMCGTFGDLGVYSFNGNKIITTSGGGALVSKKKEWIVKAGYLASQARDPAVHYEHTEIGYNYGLSNISAGIGRGQMEVLSDRVRQRRANFEYYKAALKEIPGILFLDEMKGSYSNRWLTTILIDPGQTAGKEKIRLALKAENIESRPLWKPMHLQPVFADFPYFGTNTSERLFDSGLCLPSGSNLRLEDLERVVNIIKK